MFERGTLSRIAGACFIAGWMQGAQAQDDLVNQGVSFALGARTSQLIGHLDFCKRYKTECTIKSRSVKPIPLTDAVWRELKSVNTYYNGYIKPKLDWDQYKKEDLWTYVSKKNPMGDCEDYALEKRRALHKRGIPLSNLLITVVRKSDGEGHAILTVRTDKGDFILDNLNAHVVTFNNTGYTFLKAMDPAHTGYWRTILPPKTYVAGGPVLLPGG